MIVAKLSNKSEYYGIHPELDKALDCLTPEFLEKASTEKTLLDGEDLFVTKFHLETVPEEQTFFEAHKQYLDIQMPGNFLIVFPGDDHRLKLPVGASGQAFTRVVFKIKVND